MTGTGVVFMPWRLPRATTPSLALMLALGTLALGGCVSTASVDGSSMRTGQFFAGQVPSWAGGEPVGTPTTAAANVYPNVFDQPPARPSSTLTDAEQKAAAAELNSLRSHVNTQVKSAIVNDEENTAAAVSQTTKGQVGQVDDQFGRRLR
jgi:hypothetical protein